MFFKKNFRILTLIFIIVFSLLSIFNTSSAEKITVKLASAFEPGHTLCKAAERFKEQVENRSNGDIEVQLFLGGVMGSEEEIIESLAIGGVEMLVGGGIPIKYYAPKYMFFDNPFVMKDWDHYKAVWDGPIGQEAQKIIAEKGNMKFLGWFYYGRRNFTSNKPIYTAEDIEGIKLRLPNMPTTIKAWEALGAVIVPVALNELFGALQMGVAEASEGDLPQIQSFHLDEVQKYLTLTEHKVQTGGLSINKDFFDNLSKENQDMFLDAGEEISNWANQVADENETKILIDLQQKGMQVIIPDRNSFFEKGELVTKKLFETEWPVTTWEEVLSYSK